ncbi:hypothetical protein [Dyella silvatica]|uniref:hypothetical protein n=1 Tax=Dyella silvatica TaxID=2992128 RepID=UPI002250A0D2|nr:hypothetical protein [Dyella silvatica]
MNSVRDPMLAGVKPSEALRQLYGDTSSSVLITKVDDEFNGIPSPVLIAIASWNRRRIPGREGMGLSDAQFDEAVTPLLAPLIESR